MSDIKIQTSALDELAGGQAPLTERRGNESNQSFPLSGRSGTNVEMGSPRTFSPTSNNREAASVSGMAVSGRMSEPAKHVDQRCIQGSYPGDTRRSGDTAAGAVRTASGSERGPRDGMGQFPLSGKTPAAPAPQSFAGDTADSDAGN